MKFNLPADPETCPRCYVGRIKKGTLTLTTLVNGKLLSAPNFPAWVCDVCHAFMYDPKALADLNAVLAPQPKMSKPARPKNAGSQSSASRMRSKKLGKTGSPSKN